MPWIRTAAPTAPTPAHGDVSALFPTSTLTAVKDPANPTFAFDALPESIVKVDGTYYATYQTWSGGTPWEIGLASASDRDGPWTDLGTIYELADVAWAPAAADTIYAAEIMEHDGTFYLWYSIVDSSDGSDGYIGYATADAPTGPWTDHGAAVLSPGTAGSWDSLRVGEPSVIHHDGRWVMAYMGETTAAAFGASEKVGIATADAPEGPWTKAAANPTIGFGDSGEWDDALIADPFLFFVNGYYWIMYAGAGTVGPPVPAHQGFAYANDPTGTWTRHADNPVIDVGGSGSFDEDHAFRGCVWIEDGLVGGIYAGLDSGRTTARGGNFRLTVTAPEGGGGGGEASSTTAYVPLANGDPDAPAYLFAPDGTGIFVEVTL